MAAPVPATLVSLASESVEMSAKRQSTGACELLRVDCINGTSFQLAQGLRIFCGLCACGAGAIVATVRRGGRIICQFYLQRDIVERFQKSWKPRRGIRMRYRVWYLLLFPFAQWTTGRHYCPRDGSRCFFGCFDIYRAGPGVLPKPADGARAASLTGSPSIAIHSHPPR